MRAATAGMGESARLRAVDVMRRYGIVAVFVALCNLVVDLLYAVLDPRVRTR